jgi:tetratricopeptide (TPR) repeat protein
VLTRITSLWMGFVLVGVATAARDTGPYRNFELPKVNSTGPDGHGKLYVSQRISLKNEVRQKTSRVDAKKFLFAKEAFLAEKREEAIKLLRQQMDSGLNVNRENMVLRLGQLYAEKYMELSYQETEVYTAKLQEYEAKKAAGTKAAAPVADNSRSKKYLKDALKLFYELERKFPNHPKIDEIIFFIGFVEMEGGNRTKGAKYLERVIQKYPKSRKFEEAVIYLGDYYFDRSDFKAAQAKFSILVRQKESPMHHYAVYKMAWCELNQMHADRAVREMKQLVKDLEGEKDPAKFNLREQAIRDLVVFYGDAGNIDDAMEFFSDTVGRDKAVQNLRLIADILRNKAHDAEAIRAYQRLMKEMPDSPEAPLIQLGIYESLQRMDKTGQAVESLVWALEHYGPKSDWADDYRGDKAELQSMLKTLQDEGSKAAFFYHASAQKGSNKTLYTYALNLYSALLSSFPEHPEKKKFLFYRAEVLYGQKKWLEAANSYMDASKVMPKDKLNDEAVYNALLALDELTAKVDKIERYTEEQQKKVDLTPRDIPEGEQRFIEIAQYYLQEYPKGARVVDVQYRIAAIYYRYHHFDKAVALFQKIALEHPKHRSGTTAAYIALDVLNMQKQYDKLDEMARLFARTPGLGDKKFQGQMKEISGQIGFKQVEKLEAQNKWKEAGETYAGIYQNDPASPLAEKALYNALVSFEKAGETAKAQDLTRKFIAKYPKSQYTEPLVLSMAKNAEKLYEFDEAQRLYYDFAKNHPKSKEARKALYNSAVFAELLEKNASAIERYNEYLKGGRVSGEEARAIQVSLAALHRRSGNWDAFRKTYAQMVRDTPKVEEKLALLGELARQYDAAGRQADKSDTANQIRSVFASSGKSTKNIGVAAEFIAEAAFRNVQPQRRKYEETEIRFPVSDLVYLVGLKQRRLKNLGTAYDQVIELGVPEWGVASLHDKAQAFASYGAAFRKVQIPGKLKDDERKEAELGLKKLESEIVAPLDKQADEIFKLCAAKAAEFHVATDYAARCRSRVKAEAMVEITGQFPNPGVYSESPRVWDKSIPSADDSRYLDYLASIIGSGDGADKRFKEYLAKHPSDQRALYLLGVHYLRLRKESLAYFFLGQLEKDPSFKLKSLLLNNLGVVALKDKNRPAALDYFERATKEEPELSAPYVNLGSLFLQSRSYADAERAFRKAEAIDRESEDAVLGLGVALEGQAKYEAAHEVYSEFIDDNRNALAALYNDAVLLGNRLGQKEKASELMTRYLQNGGKESAKAQETLRNWR